MTHGEHAVRRAVEVIVLAVFSILMGVARAENLPNLEFPGMRGMLAPEPVHGLQCTGTGERHAPVLGGSSESYPSLLAQISAGRSLPVVGFHFDVLQLRMGFHSERQGAATRAVQISFWQESTRWNPFSLPARDGSILGGSVFPVGRWRVAPLAPSDILSAEPHDLAGPLRQARPDPGKPLFVLAEWVTENRESVREIVTEFREPSLSCMLNLSEALFDLPVHSARATTLDGLPSLLPVGYRRWSTDDSLRGVVEVNVPGGISRVESRLVLGMHGGHHVPERWRVSGFDGVKALKIGRNFEILERKSLQLINEEVGVSELESAQPRNWEDNPGYALVLLGSQGGKQVVLAVLLQGTPGFIPTKGLSFPF